MCVIVLIWLCEEYDRWEIMCGGVLQWVPVVGGYAMCEVYRWGLWGTINPINSSQEYI